MVEIKMISVSCAILGAFIISFSTGCTTVHQYNEYEVLSEKPDITVSAVTERSESKIVFKEGVYEIYPEGEIMVPVIKDVVDFKQKYRVISTPYYDETWEVNKKHGQCGWFACGDPSSEYLFLSVLTVGIVPLYDTCQGIFGDVKKTVIYDVSKNFHKNNASCQSACNVPGSKKLIRRRQAGLPDQIERTRIGSLYELPSSEPAINEKIYLYGKDFMFDGRPASSEKYTDNKGLFKTVISPQNGFLKESDAETVALQVLSEIYHMDKIHGLLAGLSLVSFQEHTVRLETRSSDKLDISAPIYRPVAVRKQIDGEVRSLLEAYLSEKFPMKPIPLEVIQKDSEIYLHGVVIKTEQIEGPTTATVSQLQVDFLRQFYKRDIDLKLAMVDSGEYISTFPAEFTNDPAMTHMINIDCKFSVKFVHPDHYAYKDTIDVKDTDGKVVEMARLPAPVEQRSADKNANKGSMREL